MISFAKIDNDQQGHYIRLLSAIAKLSKLYSDSDVPIINYRAAENIFCKCFNAKNLSRSDTAFDADYQGIGVGLKTFRFSGSSSMEKVAEFNRQSEKISALKGTAMAHEISRLRNERIKMAKRVYNLNSSIYHIVGRRIDRISLFEVDYEMININSIRNVRKTSTSLKFEDEKNEYSYNLSKSTLFRRFTEPNNAQSFTTDIIDDPYSFLLSLHSEHNESFTNQKRDKQNSFIVLPLYGSGRKVYRKSGLNQWNASGRKRDLNELYIPVPAEIHKLFPNFFGDKEKSFDLTVPTGEKYSAKLCQGGDKALMTNPNKALSDWLLRRILMLEEGELATIEKLDELGIDSVIIRKMGNYNFEIDIMPIGSYERFIRSTQ